MEDPYALAADIAPLIGLTEQEVLEDIQAGGGFVWVKRRMEQAEYEAVRKVIKEKSYQTCLGFRDEAKRYYPNDALAANVLGFVGTDDKGLDGVESLAAANFGTLTGTADFGFEALKYGNVPVMYDPNCPDDKAYLINTKYLRLHVMRHVNMKVSKLSAPWIMDANGTRITWEGQLCLWKADRTQAVINNASV